MESITSAKMEPEAEDLSDSFDELKQQLPVYQPRSPIRGRHSLTFRQEDSFQSWQINRFNRIGPVPLYELLYKSYHIIKNNIRIFLVLYNSLLLVLYILQRLKMTFIRNAVYSAFVTFCYSYLMSFRSNQTFRDSITKMLSLTGIVSFVHEFIRYSIGTYIIHLFKIRSSLMMFWVFTYFCYEIIFFFVPCLGFDAKPISTSNVLKFSFKIQSQANILPDSTILYFASKIFELIGPFTLGVTYWFGVISHVLFFEAVCGSANTSFPRGV